MTTTRYGGDDLEPAFYGPMDPVHPCRILPTRHCPAVYDAVCGDRPCARYQSDDETPWLPEIGRPLGAVRMVPRG